MAPHHENTCEFTFSVGNNLVVLCFCLVVLWLCLFCVVVLVFCCCFFWLVGGFVCCFLIVCLSAEFRLQQAIELDSRKILMK